MISGLFIFMVVLAGIFALYALLRNDQQNYTHVLMAFASAIIFFLCGFEMLTGVTHHAGATMTVTMGDEWISMLFILLGAIMILYAAIRAFDIAKDIMAQLEGGE